MNLDFIGRFHPLMVHLPIGILALAAILEYLFPKRTSPAQIQLVLLIGSVSSVLAAILGWFLSLSAEYDVDLLNKHKWTGIILSFFTVALWAWKYKGSDFSKFKIISNLLFGSMLLFLVLAGHYGGSLTHGVDFLSIDNLKYSDKNLSNVAFVPVTGTTNGSVYDKLITPILSEKCYNCHNPNKTKGNLKMQTYAALLKGGKTGPAIVAGDALHSELVKRTLLDLDDKKRMPPKGKKQLTSNEITLLKWWINNGASERTSISEAIKNDTIHTFLAASSEKSEPSLGLPPIKKADSLVLLKLKETLWEVNSISKGSPYLDVNAVSLSSLSNQQLNVLQEIKDNIAWLNLANTQINDQAFKFISQCKNVLKLNLANTNTSSIAVNDLKKISKLQYLNIVGTRIDDAGLTELCEMGSLKNIYCWSSKVTPNGVESCKKKYPKVKIDIGEDYILVKK
jgi:uncharacterized membrane protein